MSLLADLLQAKDSLFELSLRQLEDLTDRSGVDTALTGDILAKAYKAAASLGLDADFNAKELYYSLINKVKQDDAALARKLGGRNPESTAEMIPLIVRKVSNMRLHKNGWFMKEKVAKRMLRQMPPKQVMKLLGYRSLEKMLAQENLYELYGALRFAEDPKWLNRFLKQYKQLTFADFEHRPIKIISYDQAKWGDIAHDFIAKKLHNITHLKELGVIMSMPMRIKTMPGVTLKVMPLLLHYVYEVRLYSSFFKLISIKKNFGELLVDTLIADPGQVPVLDGRHRVHWRVIQRYLGKLKHERHKEIFEPHVQPEDLHWRKAEEILYKFDPRLEFWKDMDYVGFIDSSGQVTTFNLMDVALSYSNGIKFEDRYLYHFRESLWNEVFIRYMGQEALEREILQKLDNEVIAPEKVKIAK